MTRACRTSRHDEGAGSLLVVSVMTVLVLLGAAVMALLVAMSRHERVQTAADTAAEAAVGAVLVGAADPCGIAARGVEAQGLRQVRCTLMGDVAEVVVDEPAAPALFRRPAYSRAGAATDAADR